MLDDLLPPSDDRAHRAYTGHRLEITLFHNDTYLLTLVSGKQSVSLLCVDSLSFLKHMHRLRTEENYDYVTVTKQD